MDQKPPPEDATPPAATLGPREIDSTQLLQGDKEILIRHSGETYRLRLTKNDKLILQK